MGSNVCGESGSLLGIKNSINISYYDHFLLVAWTSYLPGNFYRKKSKNVGMCCRYPDLCSGWVYPKVGPKAKSQVQVIYLGGMIPENSEKVGE